MNNVFLHTRSPGKMDWVNTPRQFLRLPVVGEFVTTDSTSDWYKVELVVHCAFEADFAAEVYAVKADHLQVIREACRG
ncbi:MAG: hypothetical protein AB1813_16385 [Verrucomicrobiota bacterium]